MSKKTDRQDECTLASMDALMCEADDLYLSMQEAADAHNTQLVQHYATALQQQTAIFYALNAILAGATVN